MIINLFPFTEYWWFYMVFTGFVWLLLAVEPVVQGSQFGGKCI